MIAVTGATGALGGRVAAGLAELGVTQRLVVRDPSRAPDLSGAEVVGGANYADGEAMRRAFDGADTVFFVSAGEDRHRVDLHRGVVDAAAEAGLLVVGLSDRWRQEGLGPMRSELASAAPAPVLFVRRGERAGALAPREDVTRFTWSSPNIGMADLT